MHVEALNIFCEVVRHQSFSRGANASSVSQSAASQTVRQLENQLGIQLIDRSKRPWRLTSEGKIFFKGCQEIVERYYELQDAIRQPQNASGHTVRVASIYSIHLNDLTSYINKFQSVVPSANVEVAYMHPDQVHEQVLNDQYDLGLISFANPGRGLTAIQWEDQAMVVACLPTHRLVSQTNASDVNPCDLSGEAFITFDRGLPVRKEIDRFLRRHKANVKVVAEFDNIENIKQAIEDGAGIAILPESTLRREVDSMTLVKLSLRLGADTPPLIRPLSILHRRGRRLNPAVMAFIDLLKAPSEPSVAVSNLSAQPPKVGVAV
tara:strand:+ start:24904 stop:25866 length:963 start_codon:yes stop_codon:yes gene_type:complete